LDSPFTLLAHASQYIIFINDTTVTDHAIFLTRIQKKSVILGATAV